MQEMIVQCSDELRDMVLSDFPYLSVIDTFVIMGNEITHPLELRKRNRRQPRNYSRKMQNLAGCLSDHGNPHHDRISLYRIIPERVEGHAAHVTLYRSRGFEHIE